MSNEDSKTSEALPEKPIAAAGMTGGELAQVIKTRSPQTPIVMCSGNPPKDCSAIDIVIRKPTYLLAIKDAIDKILLEPR